MVNFHWQKPRNLHAGRTLLLKLKLFRHTVSEIPSPEHIIIIIYSTQ